MDLYDRAQELITLDKHNPKFSNTIQHVIYELEHVNESLEEIKKAGDYLRKLRYKIEGTKGMNVYNVLQMFKVEYYTHTVRSNKEFIFRVNVTELFECRNLISQFIVLINKTVPKGMYKPKNKYAVQYVNLLAKTFLAEYKVKDEGMWTAYFNLRNFVLSTFYKGLLDTSSIQNIVDLIKKMDDTILQQKREIVQTLKNETSRMNIFGNSSIEHLSVYDEDSIVNEIVYKFLSNQKDIKNYMFEQYNILSKLEQEGKLDSNTKHAKEMRIKTVYNNFIYNKDIQPYAPIETLYYILRNKRSVAELMSYTEAELYEACKFAKCFNEVLSDDVLISIIVMNSTRLIRNDKAKYGAILPATYKANEYNFDYLIKANIMDKNKAMAILEKLYKEE